MTYIEQKLKEFKELKIIDGQEADGIIDENTRISDWIKQALTEAYNKGQTDYHNHIVESWDKYVYDTVEDKHFNRDWLKMHMKEFISLLQDTNPKE